LDADSYSRQVALALAIREHGQKSAGAALRQESQFMTKKHGNKQKVAVNKVRCWPPIAPKARGTDHACSCGGSFRSSWTASSVSSR
jgi:hypothetical protein